MWFIKKKLLKFLNFRVLQKQIKKIWKNIYKKF